MTIDDHYNAFSKGLKEADDLRQQGQEAAAEEARADAIKHLMVICETLPSFRAKLCERLGVSQPIENHVP
jgi:hypothetical protein